MKIFLTAYILSSLCLTSLSHAASYPIAYKKNPFVGSHFYTPNDLNKHTSILMLHGSEGGSAAYIDLEGTVLAMQGYNILSYCYFDCNRGLNGPRQTLKDVEVTTILDAVAWLRTQSQSNGKVIVYGFSRGAELTMIIGSLPMTSVNRPDGLIAHSPSDVFNGAWNWDWNELGCWLCKAGFGKCSEDSQKSDYEWNPSCGLNDPTQIDFSQSAWLVSGKNIPAGTRIEIEKYDGPILITVGEQDEVWPVDQTRRIEATLKAANRNPKVHYFPAQGHSFRGSTEIDRRNLVTDFVQSLP
ncbi:MAG: alpha/beta hydrolase family protein [Pseudobdellovibrionaceae bacterium]